MTILGDVDGNENVDIDLNGIVIFRKEGYGEKTILVVGPRSAVRCYWATERTASVNKGNNDRTFAMGFSVIEWWVIGFSLLPLNFTTFNIKNIKTVYRPGIRWSGLVFEILILLMVGREGSSTL